ncbi:pilus assembly protein PilE [Rubrivivax gelatinosus]|nr:pilus assembly protein PilE [Rubrivivax gelatinosus]
MHAAATQPRRPRGFTLIELMVALVVLAILAAIAFPSYRQYIAKQRVASAQADLVSLGLNLDGHLLNHTTYPAAVAGTANLKTTLAGWKPVAADDFDYELVAVDNSSFPPSYQVKASGTSSTVSGCEILLSSDGSRSKSGCPGGATTW